MMMIQTLLPPPSPLECVKFGQIDHCSSLSPDKAVDDSRMGEHGIHYFSFKKMNCLSPFSPGTETIQS